MYHKLTVYINESFRLYFLRSSAPLIKLACESQLTEILFKLIIIIIIKLACESQLTEILFKLIKLACESQLTEILFKLLIMLAWHKPTYCSAI